MLILNAMWKDLKIVINNNTSHTKKYQDHIPNSLAHKFVCVDDKFSKQVILYRGKNTLYKFIDAILEE